jgi:hypothetical protein
MKKLLLTSTLIALCSSVSAQTIGSESMKWSGTTPDLGPDSYCTFTEINDGEMTYIPPVANASIGRYMPGHWRTTKAATVKAKSLHAKSLIVEGINTLYRDESATNHKILIDYMPDTVSHVQNSVPNTNKDPNAEYSIGSNQSLKDVYDTQFYTKTWGYSTYTVGRHELQGVIMGGDVNIPGRLNARNRFEMHYIESGCTGWSCVAGTPIDHYLEIAGVAYMLDDSGEPFYSEAAAGPDGDYFMEDGNYHIKHKVTCLQ